jgi:peptide/nickel transport system ATP-binding protein
MTTETEVRQRSQDQSWSGPLLDVQDLIVDYFSARGRVRAVDHISFSIQPGEIVGLAGESGCGKSTTAFAILRLLKPPTRIGGQILFKGQDLVPMDKDELQQYRWRRISMVFQSAMNALNPVLSVGAQFVDMMQTHEDISKSEALHRAGDLMQMVGIDKSRLDSFAHELSGGMRQRVVIAMALALNPQLILMDEPTTALDVVVQREILQELQDLQQRLGFAVLFITHDLSLLVEFSNRIAVMYAGEIVEMAESQTLFRDPKHPYTVGLMSSFPSLVGEKKVISGIPGSPPDLSNPPRGCRFHPRCPYCTEYKTRVHPELQEVEPGHLVACHLYGGENES